MTELKKLPSESVHCCVTSPPYFGLRDYGIDGQIGLEKTPIEYVEKLTEIFGEFRRVLRSDGTLWLNLGDSYASGKGTCYNPGGRVGTDKSIESDKRDLGVFPLDRGNKSALKKIGLKPKDLIGIPWRVAFALQDDGWYLRSDIIWHKPNPMPESVTDRPTKSHEYIFLLSKNAKYYFGQDAVREDSVDTESFTGRRERNAPTMAKFDIKNLKNAGYIQDNGKLTSGQIYEKRNIRSVWTMATQPQPEAHFATFPEELVERCIKAGTSEKGCCPECGSPWERVVETTRENYKTFDHPKRTGNLMGGGVGKNFPETTSITTGWKPTCNHGKYTCNTCLIVLELKKQTKEVYHDGERLEQVSPGDNELSLLRERIYRKSGEIEGQGVLYKGVRCEMDDEGAATTSGQNNNDEGLCCNLESNSPNGIEGRIYDGTPIDNGESYRQELNPIGGCSSQERNQDGQQNREPIPDGKGQARRRQKSGEKSSGKMSSMWARLLGEGKCPICSKEIEYTPFDPIPCTVLDCFSGTNTTGRVAKKLDRQFIAIELNPKYIEIAERVYERDVGLLL